MTVEFEPNEAQRTNAETEQAGLSGKEAVTRELESILKSPFFQTTKRSKQFLDYVVRYKLDGHKEPLKERIIGAEVFQRPAGYTTGDDAVVRVQAGEVRRRLEQYYHATPEGSSVRIELPVGSYTPEFIWTGLTTSHEDAPTVDLPSVLPKPAPLPERRRKQRRSFRWAFLSLLLLVVVALALAIFQREKAHQSALYRFWSPAMATSEPILICLAKPTVYRPTGDLYQMHTGPDKFKTEFERLGAPPPLSPNDTIKWKDMVEYPEWGVARGDVYAAIRLSSMLGGIGKDSRLRIGDNYSFVDLRSAPAVMIGAFNNRWAMQMVSNLHFTFVEENKVQMIREQGNSGRNWQIKWSQIPGKRALDEDYGLISRLLDSKTGQFVVTAAGITANGTQSASEFISSQEDLERVVRDLPADWPTKNLQIVIHTTVTDSVPGPLK